ncbi:MAG: hypothetical protein U0Y10_10025 [Spirosomataceae bacterium]
MKTWLLVVLVAITQVHGQDTLRKPRAIPVMAFKWAPLSMFDIDPTYQFATEWFLAEGSKSFQIEGGYGKRGSIPKIWNTTAINPAETWRGRAEMRWYNWQNREGWSHYTAIEGVYKQVNEQREDEIGKDCSGVGGCSYVERIGYLRTKQVIGLSYKAGWQYAIDHFVFDLYVGCGFRAIAITGIKQNEENGFINVRTNLFERRAGWYAGPQLNLGFKVGYLFTRSSK